MSKIDELMELVDNYAHECAEDARSAAWCRKTEIARVALLSALIELVADAERWKLWKPWLLRSIEGGDLDRYAIDAARQQEAK